MRNRVCHQTGHFDSARRVLKRRRGAIIVLTAILMIVLMGLLALSIDTGYMYTMQTELDRSVDAAALAGAASLVDGTQQASDKVVEYLVRNPVGSSEGAITDERLAEFTSQFLADHGSDYDVQIGNWNAVTGQLEPVSQYPSAIAVSMRYPNLPLFFGRVLGKGSFSIESQAIAMYQPRDIALVLDFSGSMNDDSELQAVSKLGFTNVMNNLQQMYAQLGSPQYGDLEFEPQYITVEGQPPLDATQPQITVEYRYNAVYVTSTLPLDNVVLKFSDNTTRKFSGLSGTTGTFSYNGKAIYRTWVKSGNNLSGEGFEYGEPFDFSSTTIRSTIKAALGLDTVPYPYPSGSWNSFIDYGRNDSANSNAGFKYKFGYANLISYWLAQQPASYQTPDLWKVSAEPVTAVKDSVDVFMDYIQQVDTNDRVALIVYDGPDGNALVETPLTTNLALVADLMRHRQAGHYHNYTNIGAGMEAGRRELEQNGRTMAFKMIVLMTDGNANWHNGVYDTTAAVNHVISEAYASAGLNFPIVTISLGVNADVSLMNQVAEITESRTFNVPGGASVAAYREGLFEVFRDIADNRPLKLVH